MKHVTLLLCLGCIFSTAVGQPLVHDPALLDTIRLAAREQSVKTSQVNWDILSPAMDSIHEAEGLVAAAQYLLHELGDYHGRIWLDNMPYNGASHAWIPSSLSPDSVLIAQYRQTRVPVLGQMIGDKYAYLRIPGIQMSEQDGERAREIARTIENLEAEEPEGWVIDLRLNGGGTMYPMLAGLAPFYGSEPIGAFVDEAAGFRQDWQIRDGEVFVDTFQMTRYGINSSLDLSEKPVVVLLSRFTTSSGEVVAISFKGRPNTYFLGESTGGYTTGVSWQPLSDRVVLQLTTSYYADRNGVVYEGTRVEPDESLEGGDDLQHPAQDAQVKRAIGWLESR